MIFDPTSTKGLYTIEEIAKVTYRFDDEVVNLFILNNAAKLDLTLQKHCFVFCLKCEIWGLPFDCLNEFFEIRMIQNKKYKQVGVNKEWIQ